MCNIANLFDTNIRKFDAKKHILDFSHKNGGVGKIGGIVFKKGGVTYFHTS